MKIIELNSVSKGYNHDSAKALNEVSLKINSGERTVILGPSGCGKTTILRLIAGFIAPDSGSISIGGQKVAENGRILVDPEHRNLGMVFQDLALWPHLTVRGNIEFGLRARGIRKDDRKEKLKKILELVGLKGFGDRKPAQLSGGQQQRVALARALVLEPGVLLMDEPLSSLDFELNVRLRKEILRLHKELNFTLLYVTHNREEANDIATRVVVMNKGCISNGGSL
ncbi:MAG: iron ABC transporter ATP-binding protein [Acidobacteria bacterium]|nr:MAG: iron ABC transporter ATP-binding protein [Acidobacteriota bacterium]